MNYDRNDKVQIWIQRCTLEHTHEVGRKLFSSMKVSDFSSGAVKSALRSFLGEVGRITKLDFNTARLCFLDDLRELVREVLRDLVFGLTKYQHTHLGVLDLLPLDIIADRTNLVCDIVVQSDIAATNTRVLRQGPGRSREFLHGIHAAVQ